jgi:hypothetical protein
MSINHRDPDLLSVPDLDAAIAQEFDLTARAYASDSRAAAELWLHLVDDKGWMPVTNPWQVDSPYEVAIWAVRGEKLADRLAAGWGNSREEALARAALLADYAGQTKE